MYLCPACEHRHVPPTGIRCPHVQQPRSTPLEASARSQRLASRRARTPSTDENDDYLRCSGRTRRSLRPSTGPGSSSEDEHSQDMFVTQPTTSEGRSTRPEEAPAPPPALPPIRSTRPPESIAVAGSSSSRHVVPDTQMNSPTSRVTPTGSLPSVISDTSDPSRSVSPADLQADSQPVRRLRKDPKSSTAADQFLKDIGYLRSGLGNGQNRTQTGAARHTLSPIHLARSTGLRRRQTGCYPTDLAHTEGSCAESLACARSGHHSLPPLSVGELPASHRAHHRWDYLHPLLRLLPAERREKA